MNKIHLLVFAAFILFSCQNRRELELDKREQSIAQREQQFEQKESDYKALVKMRDSILNIRDSKSPQTWPDSLRTIWNSKLICRESNCSNYVIGDQRAETLEFVSDSTGLRVKIINNNKLLRIYDARYDSDKIILDYASDSTSARNIKINVVLDNIREKVIHGTQTIIGDKGCVAKFSVELIPSEK